MKVDDFLGGSSWDRGFAAQFRLPNQREKKPTGTQGTPLVEITLKFDLFTRTIKSELKPLLNADKQIKGFLFGHVINILLTELSWSVWENLDRAREYRPHYVQSLLTSSVKILPYRPTKLG